MNKKPHLKQSFNDSIPKKTIPAIRTPLSLKEPQTNHNHSIHMDCNPVWQICSLDKGGKWGWKSLTCSDTLWNILETLKNHEMSFWKEIFSESTGNNQYRRDVLSKDAQERLEELNLEDLEFLYTFRLSGSRRVWGYRREAVFRILWWDPNHEVYPLDIKDNKN